MSLFGFLHNYFERCSIKNKIKIAKRYINFIAGDHALTDELKVQFIFNALKHISELESELKILGKQ